jgi:2-hydroxy-6-oxonona-2,4-dienedioate hydrolase
MVPAIRALSPDFLVYAPDLPGYGRTKGPRDALPIARLADSLIEWMTAMRIDRPLLIGNSLGCQILADLAVRFPPRVERLVLIGPTMDRGARSGPKQFWRLVRDVFREAPSQPFVVAYDYLRFGPRRFSQTFSDALEDRIERKLPRIAAPVLVIRGANDPIAPRLWARELADLAPAGRYAEVADTGHTVNYMAPRALARAVRRFIRDVPYTGDRYGGVV